MISDLSEKHKRIIFTGLLVGTLLSALTSTVVSTAMPKIIASLGGMKYLSWALTAYMLTSTISMPIAGKLSDMFGRKYFYLGGISLFIVGNFLCGTSSSTTEFIIFRALTGIGGGVMQSNSMTLVADLYPPAERGKYQGYIGGVFGIASLVGPLLGGYITDHWHWSYVFWVNIPIGLVAIAVISRKLPSVKPNTHSRIDYAGAAFLIAATTPMLLALTWVNITGTWLSPTVMMLFLLSLLCLLCFIVAEKKASEPILPLSLFSKQVFSLSVITTFFMAAAMFGVLMYIPMFVQGVLSYSASGSGIALAPMMGGLILSSTITGKLVSKTGKYKYLLVSSFALMTMAMFLLSNMDVQTKMPALITNMVLFGMGMGMALPIFIVVVQSAFPHRQVGTVTSGIQFFRSIGGTFGVAVFGTVINQVFRHKVDSATTGIRLNASVPETPQALFQDQAVASLLSVNPEVLQLLRVVLAEAFQTVFLIASAILLIALILSLFISQIPLRKSNRSGNEQAGMELMAEGVAVEGLVSPSRTAPDIYNGRATPSSRNMRGEPLTQSQIAPK